MVKEQDFIAMEQYPKLPQATHPPLPMSPRSRLQEFARTVKPDKKTFPRLLRNLKCFLLDSWFEILCILIVAAIAGLVWIIHARPPRLFPLFMADRSIYEPSISYPYRNPIFSSLLTGILCAAIPIVVIILAQLWIQSFADCSSAILGLAYGLVTGTCFQVILKKSIGGLRPHFLAVCEPVIPPGVSGEGFGGIMYNVDDVCTGDNGRIDNALQSFPSGHSEIAFAGLGYLAFYLFTHLRIADHARTSRPGFWRMILVLLPILFATYIASTLVLGYHHHAHDCFFGAAIGILTASLGYRTAFRSITDSRTNSLPRIGRRLKRALQDDLDEAVDLDLDPQPSAELNDLHGDGGGYSGGKTTTAAADRRTSSTGSGSETEHEPEPELQRDSPV